MVFNSNRQCGKTLYIVKKALQYQTEYEQGKGLPPLIIVPNELNKRYVETVIYKYCGRKDINVTDILHFIGLGSSHRYRVLMDEAQRCLNAIIERQNCIFSEGTMTVPFFEDPCRQLIKEY